MSEKTIPIHDKRYIVDWMESMSDKTGESISSIYRGIIKNFYEYIKNDVKSDENKEKFQGTLSVDDSTRHILDKISDLFYNRSEVLRFLSFWMYFRILGEKEDKLERISRILFDTCAYFLKMNVLDNDISQVVENIMKLKKMIDEDYEMLPKEQKDFFKEFTKTTIPS
jgi:hypothetical protein